MLRRGSKAGDTDRTHLGARVRRAVVDHNFVDLAELAEVLMFLEHLGIGKPL